MATFLLKTKIEATRSITTKKMTALEKISIQVRAEMFLGQQCSKRAPQKRGNPGIRGFLSKGRAYATDFDKNHKKLWYLWIIQYLDVRVTMVRCSRMERSRRGKMFYCNIRPHPCPQGCYTQSFGFKLLVWRPCGKGCPFFAFFFCPFTAFPLYITQCVPWINPSF